MLELITKVVTEENVSYGLYSTGNSEAAYIIRDEDADQLVGRFNGPVEVITLRYEIETAAVC